MHTGTQSLTYTLKHTFQSEEKMKAREREKAQNI